MKAIVFIFLSIGLFSFSLGVVFAHDTEDSKIHTIHIEQGQFVPEQIVVQVGDTVIFENIDSELHWPASNIHPTHGIYPGTGIEKCESETREELFDSCGGIKEGESFQFTFKHAGLWQYHDHLHPNLGGSIEVQDSSGNSSVTRDGFSKYSWIYLKQLPHIYFSKFYYFLFPEALARKLEDTNLLQIAKSFDSKIFYWIKLLGYKELEKKIIGDQFTFGQNCHAAAHYVGGWGYRVSGNEFFEQIHPDCQSGFYHGALEVYISEVGLEDIGQKLFKVCEAAAKKNTLRKINCNHGIGHGLMTLMNYNLPEALEICNFTGKDKVGLYGCRTGVFMENVQTALKEKPDHSTNYFKQDDLHFPCSETLEQYVDTCYQYQPRWFRKQFGGDFNKVINECLGLKNSQHRQACFVGIGQISLFFKAGDIQKTYSVCKSILSKEERRWCLAGAASYTLWSPDQRDAALSFCLAVEEGFEKEICYRNIFFRGSSVFEEKEYRNFCEAAEKEYAYLCGDPGVVNNLLIIL